MKKFYFIFLSVLLILIFCLGNLMPSISAAESKHNYTDAFAKSILFYEANMCGKEAANTRLKWRGACHTTDGEDVDLDLSGGFHDCGDHVKFGLPQTYAASTLGWAYYEFAETFQAKKQDQYMLNISKHFTDYFIKCFPNDETFYYQCGDGDTDHSYWGPPEMQKTERPTFYVANKTTPGSDVAGNAAASLALMYLNYKTIDVNYADKCLDYAKRLYTFGQKYRGNSKGQNYYRPNSYYDELMWGAVWLHIATKETKYLDDIEALMTEKGIGGDKVEYYNHWTHCWDDVFGGVFLKLAQYSPKEKYKLATEENLDYWINSIKKTPGGMAYLHQWGVLKYSAAESMVALVYNKYKPNQKYVDFAKAQINYILGDNPNKISYLVGYGDKYPQFPHHRAASGRLEGDPAKETKYDPERHILYGALVGGPKDDDSYIDEITDYVYTEVGLDYNAGLVGALAGMTNLFGENQSPESLPGIESKPSEYYVEAAVTYENSQQTVINSYIHNLNYIPPSYESDLSMRYFVDLSEFYDDGMSVDDVTANIDYTPTGNTISELKPWDEKKHIYYTELSWDGIELYGKSQVQFKIFTQKGTNWDQKNDPSRIGLTDKLAKTQNITIYKAGKLICGIEPEGNPPPSPTLVPGEKASPVPTSGVSVNYKTDKDWGEGANIIITIKNLGTKAIDGWKLEWLYSGNQKISSLWNGVLSQNGQNVQISNNQYNNKIPAKGNISIGFNITYTGKNAPPTKFKFNGIEY